MPAMVMVPPTAAQSFMVAAKALLSGAEPLSTSPTAHPMACAFLAAQSLECMLKSYLSHTGITEDELSKKPYGHDLAQLWLEAVGAGLKIASQPPHWCFTLKTGHSYPYRFRYPMKLNGFGLPALVPMTLELKSIVQIVESIAS